MQAPSHEQRVESEGSPGQVEWPAMCNNKAHLYNTEMCQPLPNYPDVGTKVV